MNYQFAQRKTIIAGALTTIILVVAVTLQRLLGGEFPLIKWLVLAIAVLFLSVGWLVAKLTQRLTKPETSLQSGGVVQVQTELLQMPTSNLVYDQQLLSPRELEVLHLLAQGKTNKAIADQLFVSENTVKTHVANLYLKLEATNRTMAVTNARRLNIID